MSKFRYLNGVAIAYLVVTLVTASILAGLDPKLPTAFAIALTSPSFWLLFDGGPLIFVGVLLLLMLVGYIWGGRIVSTRIQLLSGAAGAILCSTLYGLTFFVLMLSGLRH